jgi:transcriptional regulator with XRE-family HTH domain
MTDTDKADINTRIAERIHSLRAQKGLSLDNLAQRSEVSRSMISLIERGESSPTAVVLEKIASGLSVTLASLFEDKHTATNPVSHEKDRHTCAIRNRGINAVIFPHPTSLRQFKLWRWNCQRAPVWLMKLANAIVISTSRCGYKWEKLKSLLVATPTH